MTKQSKAALLAQLAALEAEEAADNATPDTAMLADLEDHRVHPVMLGACLARVLEGFKLLGVDLYAEDGPKRVYSPAMAQPVPAPAEDGAPVETEGDPS